MEEEGKTRRKEMVKVAVVDEWGRGGNLLSSNQESDSEEEDPSSTANTRIVETVLLAARNLGPVLANHEEAIGSSSRKAFFETADNELINDTVRSMDNLYLFPTRDGVQRGAQYSDFDVLCGRGRRIQEHPGNLILRRIVGLHEEKYGSSARKDRKVFAEEIVKAMHANGNRFLKQRPKSESWEEVGVEVAKEKVCHCFRSLRPSSLRAAALTSTSTSIDDGYKPCKHTIPVLLVGQQKAQHEEPAAAAQQFLLPQQQEPSAYATDAPSNYLHQPTFLTAPALAAAVGPLFQNTTRPTPIMAPMLNNYLDDAAPFVVLDPTRPPQEHDEPTLVLHQRRIMQQSLFDSNKHGATRPSSISNSTATPAASVGLGITNTTSTTRLMPHHPAYYQQHQQQDNNAAIAAHWDMYIESLKRGGDGKR